MYQTFNVKSGASVVSANAAGYATQSGPDGLSVDFSKLSVPATASIPQRLFDFLIGLRLLRNIPLSYLVPDAALLPAESIRFFHLDQTWMDRVVDGVFSAANTGTLDIVYSAGLLASVRLTIDNGLEALAKQIESGSTWRAADGMTGMLIRSDLVRRWPDMVVRAYSGESEGTAAKAVLRAEAVSKDVMVVVFAGTPTLVQLREPHVGIRFGVDPGNTLAQRANDGTRTGGTISLTLPASRVIPARAQIVNKVGDDARMVALQLMREPYVQQFGNTILETENHVTKPATTTEDKGSVNPPPPNLLGVISVVLQSGRVMTLESH